MFHNNGSNFIPFSTFHVYAITQKYQTNLNLSIKPYETSHLKGTGRNARRVPLYVFIVSQHFLPITVVGV